jgi:hypothetical protein
MRQQKSLAGYWQFQPDPDGHLTVDSLAPTREIPVPLPWQAAFPEMQHYSGYAWYRRTVDIDEKWLALLRSGELLLTFGAVDYWCQVFVNGELAGQHEGGYTPFTLRIRSLAHAGSNEIAVRVYDPAQTELPTPRWPTYPAEEQTGGPPFDANEIPHGKQEWYINVGGIWQDVSLTAVPSTYIERVQVTTNIRTGQVHATAELSGESAKAGDGTIRLTVSGPGSETVKKMAELSGGQASYNIGLAVDQPHLWTPNDPYLYTAAISLKTSAGEDEVSVRFGFREIATREGQLLLNGEPLYLLCALDQDLYPDTIYTVPSEEFLRDGFRKAKELGLNSLRCHIKPPDPLYLDLADEMGLLIWEEVPSWRTFYAKGSVHHNQLNLYDAVKQRVRQTLEEMIRRDFNHPSIIIWTIVNEDWGTALPLSASDRAWVAEMYGLCKKLDPTRLVVDNSACPSQWGPNFHVKSDIDDFHVYANIPDQAQTFAQTIEQFSLRPVWTYSSHGDAQRTGHEPLILSEFGNWGLPSLRLLREATHSDPSWFHLGPWWARWEGEPGWPAGADERFHQLGLDRIWRDYEEFVTATQWHQYAAMKYEIELIRREQAIAGYVITELSDAYWESNGLLDFLRNPKAYYDAFGTINAPEVVIPQVKRYCFWDDESVQIKLYAARYSPKDWTATQLYWTIEGGERGEIEAPALDRGDVRPIGQGSWPLPGIGKPQSVPIQLEIRTPDGSVLARNTLDVLVLPAATREHRYEGRVAVISDPSKPKWVARPGPTGSTEDPLQVVEQRRYAPTPPQPLEPSPDVVHVWAGLDLERTLHRLGYSTSTEITPETKVAVTNLPDEELLRWVREGGNLLFLCRGPSPFFWAQGRGGTYGGGWITNFSWIRPDIHRRLIGPGPLSMPFMQVMPTRTLLGLPMEDKAVQGDFLAGAISGWVHHPSVHTVQFRYGKGRVLMTTFAIEEALYDNPVAIAMFHDLLEHLCSEACRPVLAANY